MNPAEQNEKNVHVTEDDLMQLQLQIAQRADALAQSRKEGHDQDRDRKYWLEAEHDVLSRRGEPALTGLP